MQQDGISIILLVIIGSKSLLVYLDNLVQITDKIEHKFLGINLDKYTIPHEK